MSDQRDWDKELAEIDRLMAKGGSSANVPATREAGGQAPERPRAAAGTRLTAFATWTRVLLGLLLAVGMTQWPYPSACGINLAIYLGAILTVITAGLWSAVSSWKGRLGLAHAIALGVLLWGLVLAAREILPRTGYARAERSWTCPVSGPEA